MKLIDKDALVAEIERLSEQDYPCDTFEESTGYYNALDEIATFLDTLEVKDVGISIPNIDDTLKEEGIDHDSKEAKVFKESYYMTLEKLKAQKG